NRNVFVARCAVGLPTHILRTGGTDVGPVRGQGGIYFVNVEVADLGQPVGSPVDRAFIIGDSNTDAGANRGTGWAIGTVLSEMGAEIRFEIGSYGFDGRFGCATA